MNLSPATCSLSVTELTQGQIYHAAKGPQPSASPACEGDTPHHTWEQLCHAESSPLHCSCSPTSSLAIFTLHTGQVKTVYLHPTAETLVIPCSGSLLSYLLIEKIIANLACVTQEQLMEMTVFPSILLSFFSCPGECQQLSSTVDVEA